MAEPTRADADRGPALLADVGRRFGVVPNFFRLPPDNPEIAAALWGFATFAYLDCPLPSLFKERLFVYLSRFCDVRYCVARHVGFLVGLGRPSGDPASPVESVAAVVRLLRRPLPRGAALAALRAGLAADGEVAGLPAADSPAEAALFACAAHVYLQAADAAGCQATLRRALGEPRTHALLVFLAFVRTAHFWSQVQPGLRLEDDVERLLATNARLAAAVADDPEARACVAGRAVEDELAALRGEVARGDRRRRAAEQALHLTRDELVERVGELTAARRAARGALAAAVQARDALRASEERQAFLLTLSDAVRPLADPADVQRAACRLLGEHLRADRAYYVEIDEVGGTARVAGEYLRGGSPSLAGEHRVADFGWVIPPMRTGQPLVVPDVGRSALVPAADRPAMAAVRIAAHVNAPLVKAGRLAGALCVTEPGPRAWSAGEIELVQEVAERTWAAVERARAEAALRASEDLRRLALESGRMEAWRWDAKTDRISGDAVFLGLYGFPPSDDRFPLARFTARMAPAAAAACEAVAARDLVPGEEFDGTLALADGRWVRWRGRVDRDTPHVINGVSFDVTGQKRAEERQAFLLKLSDTLRAEAGVEAVGNRATRMIAGQLGADRVYLVTLNSEDDTVLVTHESRREDLPPLMGAYRSRDFPSAIKELFERTIVYSDVRSDPRLGDAERQGFAGLGAVGFIAAPIKRGAEAMIWAAGALSTEPRVWRPDEIALFEDAVERTWAAVERARAEAARRASEEKHRTLFERMGQGCVEVEVVRDADGRAVDYRYLELNAAFERLFAIPIADAKGRTGREVFPGLEPIWHEAFDRIVRRGEPERLEYRIASLDRWFVAFAYPQGDDRLIILSEDVTERKRAEANLALLAGIADDLSRLVTPDEIVDAVGGRLGEALGLNLCLFADVDEARDEVPAHHAWQRQGGPSRRQTFRVADFLTAEFARSQRAGETFVVRDTAAAARTDARAYARLSVGAILAVPVHRRGRWVAYLTVTAPAPRDWRADEIEVVREAAERVFPRVERARAEAALRASEERVSQLVSLMPAAVYTCDAAGRLTFYNRRAAELWGREPRLGDDLERWCGSLRMWTPGGTPLAHDRCPMADAVRDGRAARDAEVVIERPDGSQVVASVNIDPLVGPDGRTAGAINVFEDVTARKRAEAALAAELDARTRLHELSERLLAAPDLPTALGDVLDTAVALHGADMGTMQVYDPAAGGLRYAAHRGFAAAALNAVPLVERDFHSTCAAAVRTETRVVAADIHADPAFATHAACAATFGYRAAVSTLLTTRKGAVQGVLTVHFREPHSPTERELRLADLYALLAAHLIERRRAEDALRERDEQLSLVQRAAGLGVSSLDLSTGVGVTTPEWRDVLGFPPPPAPQDFATFLALVHPADRDRVRALHEGAAPTAGLEYEFRINHPARGERWLFSRAVYQPAPDGRPGRLVGMALDVTARKRAEAEAAEGRLRFERVAAATPGLLYLFDLLAGRNVYVNDGVERVLGYTAAEVAAIGADFLAALIHPADLPGIEAGNRGYDRLADGAVFEHEYRMRHADGSWRLVRSRDTVFTRDPAGRARQILGLAEDVTAARHAEEELRKGRALLELVAGLGSDWWFTARVEPDGTAVTETLSPEFTRQLGYTAAELMAAGGWAAVVHPADAAETGRQMARLLAGEAVEGELRHVAKDGRVVWHQYRTRPERDAAGRVARLTGASRDITDRKRAEERVRASEARLRAVAANLPNGAAFLVDRDLRYVLAAGKALAAAGFTSADLEGKSLAEVLPPALLAEYTVNYRGAFAGRPFEVEHAAHGRHFVTHGIPLRDAAGDVTAALAVSYDITDRKQAEVAVQQARDELEARVAERTAELAAEMDRRQGLARRLATAQEDERRRVARDLHDSVGQLLAGLALAVKATTTAGPLPPAVLDRLADVRRVADALGRETHGLAVRLRPTALDDLGLAAALDQLVAEWSARTGVAADVQTVGLGDTRLPPEVETVLYRVVQEALTNVARHAGATRVSVVVTRPDGHVTAVVEDDGTGFDPDAAGRGRLGLVGMRERVALVGGELDVESSPGAGTTVFARVPVIPAGGPS